MVYIEDRHTYIEIQFKNVNKNVGNDVDGRVHERQIIINRINMKFDEKKN